MGGDNNSISRRPQAFDAVRAPRKPRGLLERYASPLIFACFVAAFILGVRHIAGTGYFETHMERVRRTSADRFLERQRGMPNASVLPSGLIFSISRRGSGDRAPAVDDVCEIHYNEVFRFHELIRDTHEGAYPVRRSPSQMVPGVAEALQLMREGDKWSLIVPYSLASGMEGNVERAIPSLANLRYNVEMVRCPDTVTGRTSDEIDEYLVKYLKTPLPAKSAPVNYDL